jgi:hypothetical protein
MAAAMPLPSTGFCQVCQREAPTARVTFHQNIGALIMRFTKKIEGDLCRPCAERHFREMTLTTALLGWWGIISFIVTPFLLVMNVSAYMRARQLPETGATGAPPIVPGR